MSIGSIFNDVLNAGDIRRSGRSIEGLYNEAAPYYLFNPVNVTGGWGNTTWTPGEGEGTWNLNLEGNPELQNLASTLLGFTGQIQNTNPMEMGQYFYDLMQKMKGGSDERAIARQIERARAQGREGTPGAANELAALQGSLESSRAGQSLQAIQGGQSLLDQIINRALAGANVSSTMNQGLLAQAGLGANVGQMQTTARGNFANTNLQGGLTKEQMMLMASMLTNQAYTDFLDMAVGSVAGGGGGLGSGLNFGSIGTMGSGGGGGGYLPFGNMNWGSTSSMGFGGLG